MNLTRKSPKDYKTFNAKVNDKCTLSLKGNHSISLWDIIEISDGVSTNTYVVKEINNNQIEVHPNFKEGLKDVTVISYNNLKYETT